MFEKCVTDGIREHGMQQSGAYATKEMSCIGRHLQRHACFQIVQWSEQEYTHDACCKSGDESSEYEGTAAHCPDDLVDAVLHHGLRNIAHHGYCINVNVCAQWNGTSVPHLTSTHDGSYGTRDDARHCDRRGRCDDGAVLQKTLVGVKVSKRGDKAATCVPRDAAIHRGG